MCKFSTPNSDLTANAKMFSRFLQKYHLEPISNPNIKIYRLNLISDQSCSKTFPFGAAHTYTAHEYEGVPPEGKMSYVPVGTDSTPPSLFTQSIPNRKYLKFAIFNDY